MASFNYISVERRNRATIITINRPEVRNALNRAAHLELNRAFDEFAADDEQWVAIITGAGIGFCAGQDLKELASGEAGATSPAGFGGLTSRFTLSKPVVAAVNGAALGGGFELALACDLIVAANNAVFALPEPKVGQAALAGGLLRLPRTIGTHRAMGMLLAATFLRRKALPLAL